MNIADPHEPFNDESREDCGYGEPRLPKPPLACDEKPSVWWPILIIAGIIAFVVSALSGCSQVSSSYDEFRDTTELSLVGGWRDSTLWGGIRFAKVGKTAEIEVMEGEKPFANQINESGK